MSWQAHVVHVLAVQASLGPQTDSVGDYADTTVAGAASQQQLGAILLFALIFFLAIAAANTLVMLTSARKPEFALQSRIGATRCHLGSRIAIESGFLIVMALLMGTLAELPALMDVAYGLLGAMSVGIDVQSTRGWPRRSC